MDREREPQYYADIIAGTLERTIQRMWVALMLVVVLLVGSNAAWIWYEIQWEDVRVSQDVDTGDGAAFVAGIGDVNYGEGQADG